MNKVFTYTFDEFTKLTNENIRFIENLKFLERKELIKTNINAGKNDDAFKITFLGDILIEQGQLAFKIEGDFEKQHVNEVLTKMNLSHIIPVKEVC